MALWAVLMLLALAWVFVGQDMIIKYFEWPSAPVVPDGKRSTNLN